MSFDIKTAGQRPIVWNLGRDKPEVYSDRIEYLQADGDELDFIKTRFQNLPISHRICIWKGGIAQFIYDNL